MSYPMLFLALALSFAIVLLIASLRFANRARIERDAALAIVQPLQAEIASLKLSQLGLERHTSDAEWFAQPNHQARMAYLEGENKQLRGELDDLVWMNRLGVVAVEVIRRKGAGLDEDLCGMVRSAIPAEHWPKDASGRMLE